MPAAASRWPRFVLAEPMQQGLVGGAAAAEYGAEGARLDGVAEGGAGAVRLDVVDGRPGARRAGALVRFGEEGALGFGVGRGQPVGAAVVS